MTYITSKSGALRSRGIAAFFVSAVFAIGGARAQVQQSPTVLDTLNPGGVLRTIALGNNTIDTNNPFFTSLGTNGRSCVSCHVPSTSWSISPLELQARFARTNGLDPVFRAVDGSNSPKAPVKTETQRRDAYSMLLTRGLIRVGLPIPAGAEFELVAVDDPYGYASARELSLFRRPLPTTNLRFLTGVMWDGRESFAPLGTTPISSIATAQQNANALFNDLMHQANDATMGHAQGVALNNDLQAAIAQFELNLATAQRADVFNGRLDQRGGLGGPENLAQQLFYVTINDALGADVVSGLFQPHSMTLYDAWVTSNEPLRRAVARGAALFGAQRINITGVAGLNDALKQPSIRGSCTTCHDTPNVGNHSVALPIDIGLTDASRRTRDMPLYTLKNRSTGQLRQTTDPGRALLTGLWSDIGKFKGPVFRGLAARPPYFHNGLASNFLEVVDFYDTRFDIGFTDEEKIDLALFLNAL